MAWYSGVSNLFKPITQSKPVQAVVNSKPVQAVVNSPVIQKASDVVTKTVDAATQAFNLTIPGFSTILDFVKNLGDRVNSVQQWFTSTREKVETQVSKVRTWYNAPSTKQTATKVGKATAFASSILIPLGGWILGRQTFKLI